MSFNVDGLNYCPLAHEIMETIPCPTCGSPAKSRCRSLRRGGNPDDPYDFHWLPPSKSHRPRIEEYWLRQKTHPRG